MAKINNSFRFFNKNKTILNKMAHIIEINNISFIFNKKGTKMIVVLISVAVIIPPCFCPKNVESVLTLPFLSPSVSFISFIIVANMYPIVNIKGIDCGIILNEKSFASNVTPA